MLCLRAQLQQILQLDYKTNNAQIHQKIELYGSPTTKDLKKPHLSRPQEGQRCRGTERRGEAVEWAVQHSHVLGKNREGHLGSERSQPQARPLSPGF